jgi:hypothetical protein
MLSRVTLRTQDDQLFAAESGGETVIHAVYLANTSSSLRRFRIHHVLQGETSSTANALFYDVAIPANSTYVDDTRIVVRGGEELRGLADGSGIVATIYGLRSR